MARLGYGREFVLVAFVLAIILFFSSAAFAAQLMSLHGRATSSGSNITSGDLRVFIYDAAAAGNLVYDSGSDFNGTIINGIFDVMLGSGSATLDLNFGTHYYLDMNVTNSSSTVNLDFNGSGRKRFEASRGNITSSTILDGTIANADIASNAGIDWNKVSKTGADLNNFSWGSDFNSTYSRIASDVNVTGNWNFANQTTFGGGFGSSGITISNGVLYTQSIVIVNDFNAATVTAIDVNGHYTPSINNTFDFGSTTNRWRVIYTQDFNAVSANIATLTLANALGLAYGGTGNTAFASGRVPFSNGTILTSDGNFTWDNSSKRLGIGTSSPGNTLKVVGDANLAGTVAYGGVAFTLPTTAGNSGQFLKTDGVGTLTWSNTPGGSGGSTYTGISPISVDNDQNTIALNVVALTTDWNGIVSGRLTGTINTSGTAIFRSDLNALDGLNTNTLRSLDNNTLTLQTRNNTRVTITADGNVGIGVTSPTKTLVVSGDANITGDLNIGNGLTWATLKDYPTACGAGQFITTIGDTVTCATPTAAADTNWQTSYNLLDANLALTYYKQNDANTILVKNAIFNTTFPISDNNKLYDNNGNLLNFYNAQTATRFPITDTNITSLSLSKIIFDNNTNIDYNHLTLRNPNLTLPTITGQTGKFLTTDGTTLNWGTATTGAVTYSEFRQFFDGNLAARMPIADANISSVSSSKFIWDTNAVLDSRYVQASGVPTDATIDANIEAILALRTPWADANVADNITIKSSNDANFYNGLTTNRVFSVDNNTLTLGTNNATSVTITADGNVGIGITTPNRKLQVVGDANITGKLILSAGTQLCSGTDANCFYPNAGGTSSNTTDTNTVTANWTNNTGGFIIDLNAYSGVNTNTLRSLDNNALSLQTNNTTRITIGTDGNVAIGDGTNAILKPDSTIAGGASNLIIQPAQASSTPQLFLNPSSGSSTPPALILNDSSTRASGSHNFIFGTGNSTVPANTWNFASTINGIVAANSWPIGFLVSNTSQGRFTALTIANDGNIGIGATNPRGLLDVNMTWITGNSDYHPLVVNKQSGFVGIGKTDPTTALDLNGAATMVLTGTAAGTQDVLILDYERNTAAAGAGPQITFRTKTSTTSNVDTAYIEAFMTNNTHGSRQGALVFSTQNAGESSTPNERMRITGDGNVGINTTTPTQKLDVNGDLNVSSTNPTITFGGASLSKNSNGDVILSD